MDQSYLPSRPGPALTSPAPSPRVADDEAIENLIDGLPEDRQAELLALAAASGDTQRKVRLWSVAHLATARAAMASDEESPWFFDSSSEAELARHHEDVRDATLSDSEAEVEDEVRHVEERIEPARQSMPISSFSDT